ncbi:TonB C-terminal domain-containing protein [SAR86 cluster bacterium]|nr:TonB C-terminal domain-containing protein [SAR86 cluster bacterium]
MINLIAGFFCSFFLHAFLFSFFFNINFNDYSEEKIIQLPVSLIFEEKIEPKPNKSSSKNVKTTSSSLSEDAKSKNDFESYVNSFFSNLEKDRDRLEQISTQSEVLKIAAKIRAEYEFLWQKPKNLPEDLFVKVLISIAPSGEVVKYEILNKSGNEVFDRSIRIALDRISSFDFIKNISRNDFEKNFREFNLQFSSN